jgi:hypothetical protein
MLAKREYKCNYFGLLGRCGDCQEPPVRLLEVHISKRRGRVTTAAIALCAKHEAAGVAIIKRDGEIIYRDSPFTSEAIKDLERRAKARMRAHALTDEKRRKLWVKKQRAKEREEAFGTTVTS